MSLKLIRDAQLQYSLTEAEVKALSIIKDAVGAPSLAAVYESFAPSADDFDTWMRVIVGEAQDRGINLSKKTDFMKLAMDVLENDPASPPIEMQEAIANKLWQDYQAAKNEVRIHKIAAAKEEEEKVAAAKKQIADRFARDPKDRIYSLAVRNAYDEEESGFEQAFNVAKGIEDEERTSFLSDVLRTHHTRAGVRHRSSLINHLRGFEDEARDDEHDDEHDDITFDELDPEVADAEPGVFTSTDDGAEPPEDEFDDDTMDDIDADVSREKPQKFYDEEEAVRSFLRQAATAPRNMMTQAIKDIEAEGASAWKQSNIPVNPHPKNSAAYRAWQKGLLAAAKESLGIVDKPKEAAKAKKKK